MGHIWCLCIRDAVMWLGLGLSISPSFRWFVMHAKDILESCGSFKENSEMCNTYKYCACFFSPFSFWGVTEVWSVETFLLPVLWNFKLFYINLETSMLAIFISFLTPISSWFSTCHWGIFSSFSQTAVFNFVFLPFFFFFFPPRRSSSFGEKLVRVFFSFISACTATKYKLPLSELLWYLFKYHRINIIPILLPTPQIKPIGSLL